jgi:tetratricopeptide (TPR) repeat protein
MARAYIAQRQGRWDDALRFWKLVLEQTPENDEALRQYQNALSHAEDA